MKDDKKQARHLAISAAAYRLLAEKGYDGASMLSIAKAAKASNETLYRWYGNKQGLFTQLARDNAAQSEAMLQQAIAEGDAPLEALAKVAPVFLQMLLGERAVLLNRAAAAEPSGELGAAISAGGRDVIQPLFDGLMGRLSADEPSPRTLTGWFLGLLIGDLQIKRVIGVQPEPSRAEIDQRVSEALTTFQRLLPANSSHA